jgi:hypothetical protein
MEVSMPVREQENHFTYNVGVCDEIVRFRFRLGIKPKVCECEGLLDHLGTQKLVRIFYDKEKRYLPV